MLELLRKQVYEANMLLYDAGLVVLTWGNASACDRRHELVVIKPSGVPYERLSPDNMVICDFSGKVVEGEYKPSTDTPTHIELYKAFPCAAGVAHTHSVNAVAFAQAGRDIRAYGTTHADTFCGSVPCTRAMTPEEIAGEYEKNTGLVIAQTFSGGIDPARIPAVLVRSHGPFTWGHSAAEAAENSLILEQTAEMALKTELLGGTSPAPAELIARHFNRKHSPDAYYGQ